MNRQVTPLGAVGRGLAAGLLGTVAMTGWQLLAAKLRSGDEAEGSAAEPAVDKPVDPWQEASVPAQLAKRVIEGVFLVDEVPASKIGLLTEVMHWGYGTAWGGVYGLLAGTTGRSTVRGGLAFGLGVWTSSYVELVPTGLYEPPWKYSAEVVGLDLSYHLVYGTGTAVAYWLLP
jgi:hypothetical protein